MARKPGGLKDGADALDNDERVRILGIIDRFRELGVNEDIALPQVSTIKTEISQPPDQWLLPARRGRRSVKREVISPRGTDRTKLPNCQRTVYALCHADHPS